MITNEELLKLTELARLSVSEEEMSLVAEELAQLLRFAETLPPCPAESVLGSQENEDKKMELREDQPLSSLSQQEALQEAPCQENGFFLTLDETVGGNS